MKRSLWVPLAAMSLLPAGHASTMLLTTAELAQMATSPSVVILHVGGLKDYASGHIPGARLITLADISITGPKELRLELPPVEALAGAFRRLGVTDSSRVVVYAGTESLQSATRVWFTLDYLGLGDRAALLDGGLAAWRAEGRPVSTEDTPPAEPGSLTTKPNPALVVDAAWLRQQAAEGNVHLLDARTPEFFRGDSPGLGQRAGRIPGARNLPFNALHANGKLLPADELRSLMKPDSRQIVTYCHIGQQATLPYFVARYLGLEPKLYDGSYQDWSMQADLPVEIGDPKP